MQTYPPVHMNQLARESRPAAVLKTLGEIFRRAVVTKHACLGSVRSITRVLLAWQFTVVAVVVAV